MKKDNETLIAEVNDLRNEVRMLKAIVQSLMFVLTEEQGIDFEGEDELDEKFSGMGKVPMSKYVS